MQNEERLISIAEKKSRDCLIAEQGLGLHLNG